MPIQAIRGEIEIEVTHECNWNCPYCAIHTHKLPPISKKQIRDKIDSIQTNKIVTISGGEPGMLDEDDIDYILNNLQKKECTLFLNTNGLFIRRYPEKISKFKQIIYHCSENLNCQDYIIRNIPCDTRYMIVVNDQNFKNLDQFLHMNEDIKFDIVQATYNNIGDGITLSSKNKSFILTHYYDRMTKESIDRMFNEKNWDIMEFI